jgi:hypothetical protein
MNLKEIPVGDPQLAGNEHPAFCYIVLYTQRDENGFIPSIVKHGEAGHYPLVGNGKYGSAWHWGKTYDEARIICEKKNKDNLGITREQADAMMICSFDGAWDKYDQILNRLIALMIQKNVMKNTPN